MRAWKVRLGHQNINVTHRTTTCTWVQSASDSDIFEGHQWNVLVIKGRGDVIQLRQISADSSLPLVVFAGPARINFRRLRILA
jgi:hypothetical protein